jgi:hypothetical protein
MKPIRLSPHAQRYRERRGFTDAEVELAIQRATWKTADLGRLECEEDFPYGKEWNGKIYATKRVRPVLWKREARLWS